MCSENTPSHYVHLKNTSAVVASALIAKYVVILYAIQSFFANSFSFTFSFTANFVFKKQNIVQNEF